MNIRLKLAALFALTALGTARAADMPVKAPPPAPSTPLYNWNGFYVGANAGGAWGNFDPTTSAPFGTIFFNVGGGAGAAANVTAVGRQSISASGFIGGLESGYNFQFGPAVFGVEGDIESMQLSGTKQSTGLYPLGSPVFAISSSASANWLATIRGRLGLAANNWLFFATGGAAFTTLKGTFSFSDNCGAVFACNGGVPGFGGNNVEAPTSLSNEKTGYAVGGGVETGLSANWTVKAEYLYVGFNTVFATGTLNNTAGFFSQPLFHSFDLRANIARLGLNYKF